MWTYSRPAPMHRHVEATGRSQVASGAAGQMADRRPTAITQARLQEMADNVTRSTLQPSPPVVSAAKTPLVTGDGFVAQLAMTKEQADKELSKALAGANLDQEHQAEEDELPLDYYQDGDMKNPYIKAEDMNAMIDALDRYMSLELDGVEPTAEQAQILSEGWVDFEAKFTEVMRLKHYGNGAPVVLRLIRTKKPQPEMPAGKTIPEIIEFLKKNKGQVCNQSIGGGILEILGQFKQS